MKENQEKGTEEKRKEEEEEEIPRTKEGKDERKRGYLLPGQAKMGGIGDEFFGCEIAQQGILLHDV